MCMIRSKQGVRYVRLCAWFTDTYGYPPQAVRVETNATYRTSAYIYFTAQEPPVSRYERQPWTHYDPAKPRN